jgi:hypothetical protein
MSRFEILYRKSERHKLNFILEQAKKAQSRARVIDPLFLWPQRARWGWVDNATLLLLQPQERDFVPILQEARLAQSLLWTGVENRAFTGFRSLNLPDRKKFLYQLSYPGPIKETKGDINIKTDMAEIILTIRIRFGLDSGSRLGFLWSWYWDLGLLNSRVFWQGVKLSLSRKFCFIIC